MLIDNFKICFKEIKEKIRYLKSKGLIKLKFNDFKRDLFYVLIFKNLIFYLKSFAINIYVY